MFFENHISFRKLKSAFGIIFGFLGGITGGLLSIDGSILTIFFSNQIKDKQILRSTLIAIFIPVGIWRNALFYFTNVFNTEILKISLFMIPVVIIATIIGSRIYLKLNQELYRRIVAGILLLSGMLLLIR